MRVKICGITNKEDAFLAIKEGADALGFVFYKPSPRYISPQEAKEIIKHLPPFVEKVGLFVNETSEFINNTFKQSQITLAQIHFDVDQSFLDQLSVPFIPVIRAKQKEDIYKFSSYYRIIDTYSEKYGGSGKQLQLDWFTNNDNSRIILAGGLDSINVSKVSSFGFYGVDVSSGTELKKGKKDPQKVKDFINNAKLDD